MSGSAGVGVGPGTPVRRAAALRASVASAAATAAGVVRGLRRRWRQSLRLRVVATTMLLGLAVVTVLGSVLHAQIAGGLERSRVQNSQYEALALTAQAQKQWDGSTSASVDALNQAAREIMGGILSAPGPDPSRYVVMNRSAGNDSDLVLASVASNRTVDLDAVSPELREAVAADPGRQQTQLTEVPIGGREVPAVIVGSVVTVPNAGPYDLYFIYPMEQEVATMDLIGNAFLVAGVILTLLVGAVAYVVTRQVVIPVRRAGEVAQRLSAGRLNERMPARGEDDLALLATSFNNMADSLQSQIRQLEGLSAVQQRFVSDVSHELRTPLTTIRMAVDVIHSSRQEFQPSVARSAELLAGELDRFEDLLADLLEISRFDAGAAALDLEPVDLRGTLDKVVAAARPARRAPWQRHPGPRRRRAGRGRDRRAAGRADPAQPRRQRRRARRRPSRRRPRGGRPGRGRGRRRGPRGGAAPGGRGQRLHPVLACGPRPGPHDRGHRARPLDLPRGRAPAQRVAAGLGRTGRGLPVPAHPPAAHRRDAAQLAAPAQPGGRDVSRRRGRLAAVLAVAATLLTGCGGLTGTGPVQPGLEVGSGKAPELGFVYPGPVRGASQEGIVRGFLRAGAASEGAYDNARKFLTSQISERWNPDESIALLADDEAPAATLLDPVTVRVTAKLAGSIDAHGRFTAAVPGAMATATFSLTSVGGQWRIDGLPDHFGRWILSTDVPRLVQPFAVHYVSTSHRATVPDVRWFPLDRLPTRLARAQLDPVPDHLVGAGTTAVPAGTRLLGDAVSVDAGGVASVNLIAGKLAPGEATRQNLWAQFLTTLTQDPTVTAVLLAVDGVPVDLAGLDGPVSSLSRVGFPAEAPAGTTTKPVVRRGSAVSVFDPSANAQQQGRQTASPDDSYPAVPPEYTRLALSADGREIAAVDPSGDGISRWRGTTRYEVPGFGSDVGAPAYDRRGFLWAGGVGSRTQRLWVADTRPEPSDPEASKATPVTADWLAGRRVVEARVAADGDRVVVLSVGPDGSGPTLDLAGVIRGDGQRPERLSAPLRLGVPFTAAAGLTWLDGEQVATIAAIGSAAPRPVVLGVDGSLTPLAEVPGARTVATTGNERDLYVVTGRRPAAHPLRWALGRQRSGRGPRGGRRLTGLRPQGVGVLAVVHRVAQVAAASRAVPRC